ncbi:methyltransferase domain-containing protein [Tsuneonella sp. HG249]
MLRYRLAAGALKAFSLNDTTRRAYRRLGNAIGGQARSRKIKANAVGKADRSLRFMESHGAIRDRMRLLELGSGWVHWEALFARCFYDVEIILFDMWDNRQFAGFRHHAAALRDAIPSLTTRRPEAREEAVALLSRVIDCADFSEVYRLLGWRYLVDAGGRLDAVTDGSVDLVFGSDALEHVPAERLPELVEDFRRILRSGGLVAQHIVVADHLCLYDPAAHRKAYLGYTDNQWQRWFDNGVQHINRWQLSDYVRLFRDHGFTVLAQEIVTSADTAPLAIAPRWRHYDKTDLDACFTRLLVQT